MLRINYGLITTAIKQGVSVEDKLIEVMKDATPDELRESIMAIVEKNADKIIKASPKVTEICMIAMLSMMFNSSKKKEAVKI